MLNLKIRRRVKPTTVRKLWRNFADSAPFPRSMITGNLFPRSVVTTSRISTVSSHKYCISMQYNMMGKTSQLQMLIHQNYLMSQTTSLKNNNKWRRLPNTAKYWTHCTRIVQTEPVGIRILYVLVNRYTSITCNCHLIKDCDTEAKMKFTNWGTNDQLSKFATENNWWFWSQ